MSGSNPTLRRPDLPVATKALICATITFGVFLSIAMLASGLLAGYAAACVTVVVAAVLWRDRQLSVTIEPDRLIVRNLFSASTVARSRVVEFNVARPESGWGRIWRGSRPTIYATLEDGSRLRLDATAANSYIPGSIERVQEWLSLLRSWLSEGP